MLSIRQLFYVLSLFYIALLFASLLFVRWLWFYPNEVNLLLERQQQELHSVNSILDIVTEQLKIQTGNHAQWVNAVNNSSEIKIPSEYKLAALLPSNVKIAIALNHELEPFYAVQRTNDNNVESILDSELFQNQQFITSLKPLLRKNSHVSDYFIAFGHLHLGAISPIKQHKTQETIGWLLLTQELDASFWQSLEKISQLEIKPLEITQRTSGVQPNFLEPLLTPQSTYERCLQNKAGHAVQCFQITHCQVEKPQLLDYRSAIMLGFTVIFPLVLFAIFLNLILNPIYRGIDLLSRINENNTLQPINFNYWLPIRELKTLKAKFNQLIDLATTQQRQLELLSNTDRLTDIPNRRAFDEHFSNTWNRLKRHSLSVALVMVDIDFFKSYNDFYGHQQGDKALQLVAQALASCARRVDEVAARYGGEEFVLILFIENQYELDQFKNRLTRAIDQLKIMHEKSSISENLTVSTGIAWLQNSGAWVENYLADDWLKAADDALYRAKSSGRNKHEVVVIDQHTPF